MSTDLARREPTARRLDGTQCRQVDVKSTHINLDVGDYSMG